MTAALTKPKTKAYWNKFAGKCSVCGVRVPQYEGVLWKEGRWLVAHLECRPDLCDDLLAERLNADFIRAQKQEREDALKKERLDAIFALEAICQIDWKAPTSLGLKQYAYSDVTTNRYPMAGSPTEEDVKRLLHLKHPAQSSWGQLTWLSGCSLKELGEGFVVIEFTYGICD